MTGKGGVNIGRANKMRAEREILTMAQECELCGQEPGIKDKDPQSIPMCASLESEYVKKVTEMLIIIEVVDSYLTCDLIVIN